MKCQHCDYEHAPDGHWDHGLGEWGTGIVGNCGGFYSLSVVLERTDEDYYNSRQTKHLYACPSCMKTFVEG